MSTNGNGNGRSKEWREGEEAARLWYTGESDDRDPPVEYASGSQERIDWLNGWMAYEDARGFGDEW